jgi:hypothetical protein
LAQTEELSEGAVALNTSIEAAGAVWQRLMIKTHVVHPGEDIVEVMASYTGRYLEHGDTVFISEKCTAISQGRLVDVDSVKPRPLAKLLAANIKRTPYGHGLGLAPTMEVAFRQVGTLRMVMAAAAGFFGKLLGRSGDFYRVAGPAVKSIDGPTTWAQPPFNEQIILGPQDPDGVAERAADLLSQHLQNTQGPNGQVQSLKTNPHDERPVGAAVVDVNDLGSEVMGASSNVNRELVAQALRDNPLGQGAYQTPLGILREQS